MRRDTRVLALSLALLVAGWLTGCDDGNQPPGGDFAVLAQADDAYEQARPGVALEFPRDHGAHPGFRIEWWYLTANLEDEAGNPWGVQWTLFRTAMQPDDTALEEGVNPWQAGQVYMAHYAVTSPDGHRAFQRYARGGDHDGIRQAGARASPFAAWLDDWRLESIGADWLPLHLSAGQEGVATDLLLHADRPLVLQGEAGFSQKHPSGGGSHYYSQPWLQAAGSITIAGDKHEVSGQAWLDREWSSQFLQDDQQGWDWFALHLDDGRKLMAFQLRDDKGGTYRHGILLEIDGTRRKADPDELELVVERRGVVGERRLPLAWKLRWADAGLDLDIEAGRDDQWMDVDFPYWEGRVDVRGTDGSPLGVGYLEMTGYGRE